MPLNDAALRVIENKYGTSARRQLFRQVAVTQRKRRNAISEDASMSAVVAEMLAEVAIH